MIGQRRLRRFDYPRGEKPKTQLVEFLLTPGWPSEADLISLDGWLNVYFVSYLEPRHVQWISIPARPVRWSTTTRVLARFARRAGRRGPRASAGRRFKRLVRLKRRIGGTIPELQ